MSRRTTIGVAALLVAGLLGTATAVPTAASTPVAVPCPNGRPAGPHVACTGPVTHHAGGGGGVLTIVVSVLVGLAVAAGALVLVRRRITHDALRPLPATSRPRRPS